MASAQLETKKQTNKLSVISTGWLQKLSLRCSVSKQKNKDISKSNQKDFEIVLWAKWRHNYLLKYLIFYQGGEMQQKDLWDYSPVTVRTFQSRLGLVLVTNCPCTHLHTHSHMHARTHEHNIHTYTHTHVHTCTNIYTYVHKYTHTQYMHTHVHTHNTCTYMFTYTHAGPLCSATSSCRLAKGRDLSVSQ